jgi:hypothetical protein
MSKSQRVETLSGFERLTVEKRPQLTPETKTALVRRGNEFLNGGRIEDAKRIFLTIGYTDGLIRVGNYHYKRNEHIEAFRMFWQAGARREIDNMAERFADVLRQWMAEDSNET